MTSRALRKTIFLPPKIPSCRLGASNSAPTHNDVFFLEVHRSERREFPPNFFQEGLMEPLFPRFSPSFFSSPQKKNPFFSCFPFFFLRIERPCPAQSVHILIWGIFQGLRRLRPPAAAAGPLHVARSNGSSNFPVVGLEVRHSTGSIWRRRTGSKNQNPLSRMRVA